MIPKKSYNFQISVERPVHGVLGDPQDSIFPDSNQYMNADTLGDIANILQTGASIYNSTQAQQTAASQAAAATANLQAQQAALLAAQKAGTVSPSPSSSSTATPKWIPWTIGGVLLIAGIVVTIVLVKK
jgi:hypothetical protein